MLIILEGTDLAGKSTLARQLVEAVLNQGHHAEVVTGGPPTGDAVSHYEHVPGLRQVIYSPDDLLILDRWHLGELVYGPLLRGRSALTPAQFAHVELMCEALGATRLVVHPPGEVALRQRYRQRGDPLLTEDQVVTVYRWYLGKLSELPHWSHCVSPTPRRVVLSTLARARVRTETARTLIPHLGYVGSPLPVRLLVGDLPNRLALDVPPPAFQPTGYNSGHFLLDALASANALDYTGLCNANDGTAVDLLWDALYKPRLVALGNRAAAHLERLKLPHAKLRHPQYERRFRYGGLVSYGRQLAAEHGLATA